MPPVSTSLNAANPAHPLALRCFTLRAAFTAIKVLTTQTRVPEKKDVHASRCTPGELRCALSLAPLAQHSTMVALVTGGLHFKSSLSEPALLLIRLFQKITSPCRVTLRRTFTAQSDMLAPRITRWLEVGGTPVTSQRGRRALRIHRSHA